MTETASNVSNLQTFLPYIVSILCALISGVASYCVARKQAKSDIKKVDTILYPIISHFIISLLNTSSAIAKNPIKQMNNIIHFKFFTINSFTFSFIFCFSFIFSIV